MVGGLSEEDAPAPFGPSSPWRGEARALLERAIERHGGWAAWRRAGGLSLALKALTGLLPEHKGLGQTFSAPGRIEVWPGRGLVVLHDFPVAGRRGVFSSGQVQLLDGETLLEARADGRASFAGARKRRRWAPIDALYFFGYALAHYHSLPFSLAAARPLALRRARSAGRALAGVAVELPASLHTHCRRQTFFFDEEGLLRRHDYVADIVGWWARGAHRWEDFVDVGGLLVARRRHVVARLGPVELPIVALHAELDDLAPVRPLASERPRLVLV
ncbi:MAG TPA: hypothetical protein VHL80_04915 [Polyangia bacterium]|nr:hypothetical protein [Polyangia bacterium]